MVNTPILFETFARVEYARKVWEAIKQAQPKKLYFYSNKGRIDRRGEIDKNNEIRSWINEIDWDCELHTWFRDECVDVYTSLRGAINWLFNNEEEGIILEDGTKISSEIVILTTGTYLKSDILIGDTRTSSGPNNEKNSTKS